MKKLISIILTAILAAALNGYNGIVPEKTAESQDNSSQTVNTVPSSQSGGSDSLNLINQTEQAQEDARENGDSLQATDGLPSSQTGTVSGVETSLQAFTSLEIEITAGSLYIRSGAAFSLTHHDGKALDYRISDGTLYFKNSRSGDVVLVLPHESYEALHLKVKNGHAYVESALTFGTFSLEVEQGEAKLEKISVSEGSSIVINGGAAFLSGDLGSSVTASCQRGQLSLQVPFELTDCNLELDWAYGNIRLNGVSYHGRADSLTLNNGGARQVKLSCVQGDISMVFGIK